MQNISRTNLYFLINPADFFQDQTKSQHISRISRTRIHEASRRKNTHGNFCPGLPEMHCFGSHSVLPNVKLTEKKPCICTHFHSSLNFAVWLPGYFDLFSKRKIKLKFGSVRMAISTCRDINCIMEQI